MKFTLRKGLKARYRHFFSCLFIGLALIGLSGYSQAEDVLSPDFIPQVQLTSTDRVLVLAPHPDDEVLGCAGVIQHAIVLGLPVKIVFLTYGDSNQWSFLVYRKHPVIMPRAVQSMGLVRHTEALDASQMLGVSARDLIFLGYPDFSTLTIWTSCWGKSPPVKSLLTKVSAVPYANALRPGTPYKGEEILKDLESILRSFKPTKIFLSHPADHNQDHQALYLFTRAALWDLEKEIKPEIYPYLIHYKHWPLPRGYSLDKELKPPEVFRNAAAWQKYSLTRDEIEKKLSAIKKHTSQYKSSKKYLLSFISPDELFGDFPPINLETNTFEIALTAGQKEGFVDGREELSREEKEAFVNIEERSVRIEDKTIVFHIKLSRPIGKKIGFSLYVFGYRSDRPFPDMPKLHIRFGRIKHKIFDQRKIIDSSSVKVTRSPREIVLRVPLELLGNPQRIFTSARTSSPHAYLGDLPLDWVSWQVLDLSLRDGKVYPCGPEARGYE